MMRAVETLRQRLPGAVGNTLGYSPVQASDSENDIDDADGGRGEFELSRGYAGGDRFNNRDGRRPRRRAGSGGATGVRGGVGGGRQEEDEDDMLWPPYTPLYTNMKVLRRKRLDASMMYSRAGPCEFCFAALLFLMFCWSVW